MTTAPEFASLTEKKLWLTRRLLELEKERTRREYAALAEANAVFLREPASWPKIRLQEEVWSKQREIMTALRDHRRVAVRSCHGIGKSHIASRAVAFWLDAHPPGEAFVVTTAPTYNQVRAILWRYIRQAHRKGNLVGKLNQTEWLIDGDLVGFGRKPADQDEGAFQGIHAAHVLVVLDEACGIPEQLWIAADALTTNEGCRMLAIGNPDDPSSYFASVCRPESLWHKIKVSAFDSPNFTGEEVSEKLASLLIAPSWAEEKRLEWGEENPVYKSKILGEFTSDDPGKVIRTSDLAACRIPTEMERSQDELSPVELGVDVGGGGDLTVIRERRGCVAGREWREHSDQPHTIAPLVLRAIRETGATVVKIDSIGVGAGVVGELQNLASEGRHEAAIVAVNVAEKSSDPSTYLNLRAELWWTFRLALQDRLVDLSGMENADKTAADLLEPGWKVANKGQVQIESKDDIRKRIDRSTDHADALLLAFWAPDQGPAGIDEWLKAVHRVRSRPRV